MSAERTPEPADRRTAPGPRPSPGTRPLGHVLVTGGSSGLGAAVTAAVVAGGGRVTVLDRRPPAGAGPDVGFVEVDLADPAAAQAAVRSASSAGSGFGPLDAVVTCAGMDVPAPLTATTFADWERIVRVNLFGTVAVVQAGLEELLARRGRVVTVASTLGHRVAGDATAYCASKFAVVGFTRALQAELRGKLAITLLTPGGMATAFFDGRSEQYRPPVGAPLADPAEVARCVVFALSVPDGVELKELVVTGPDEPSWP